MKLASMYLLLLGLLFLPQQSFQYQDDQDPKCTNGLLTVENVTMVMRPNEGQVDEAVTQGRRLNGGGVDVKGSHWRLKQGKRQKGGRVQGRRPKVRPVQGRRPKVRPGQGRRPKVRPGKGRRPNRRPVTRRPTVTRPSNGSLVDKDDGYVKVWLGSNKQIINKENPTMDLIISNDMLNVEKWVRDDRQRPRLLVRCSVRVSFKKGAQKHSCKGRNAVLYFTTQFNECQ